jgi:hypothetical protein
MVNNGVASHVGPGRAWVDFAARCATEGWIALRLDLSGLGDSPARPGRTDNDSYPPSAGADLRVAADQLTSIGIERVAMLGLCSGALLGFDAALAAPQIDLLIGVNGRFDKPFAESRHDMKARAAGRTARIVAVPLTKAPLFPLFDAVPTWVWRLLAAARICASPTRVVESVLRRGGIRVVMVFGTDEWGLKALRRRGGRRFERVLRDPGVSLIEVRGLDHSMFDAGARALVQTTVLDVLRQADPHGALL